MNNFFEHDERYGLPTIDDQQQHEARQAEQDYWRQVEWGERKMQDMAVVGSVPEDES